jgi:hypothetical protein
LTTKNYYELLDLGPTASNAEIKSAIEAKRTMWMRTQSRPDLRAIYDDNRKTLPDIERVMLSDASKVRDNMQAELLIKRDQYVDTLKSYLTTMASRGYLLRRDLEPIAKSDSRIVWTVQDVEREARGLGIDIRDEGPTVETAALPLERSREEQIARMLVVLQKTDLYDFLEQAKGAPLLSLETAARRFLDEARNATQKNSSVTAQAELAGIGLELFSRDGSRASYDETLRQASSRPILETAKIFAGAEGDLSAQEMHMLARMGKNLGLAREETQDLIRKEAEKNEKPWTIHLTEDCPACRQPSPFHLIYCQDEGCVAPLYNIPDDPCADCGKETPSLGEYCVNCGSYRMAIR